MPALGTVLANEEVVDGKSEVGGHPVQRIPLRQWMLRITSYGDRLLDDLEGLDWSPGIKKLQSDWIGRSTGAEVDFFVGEPNGFASWIRSVRGKAGHPVPLLMCCVFIRLDQILSTAQPTWLLLRSILLLPC